jgi:cytidyltransferase-like protein
MEQTLKGKSFGSLIGLKNNAAEPYILLHQYTFPPVLNRIARSNIANYSIFLLDGLLFGFYDYLGSDHDVDMAAMAGDHDTVQWWKLTEPMQQPLPGRKPGEWWASMIHLRSLKHDAGIERGITRKAFRLENSPGLEEEPGKWLPDHGGIIIRSELFSYNADLFLYIETNPESAAKVGEILPGHWQEMREVFHTDGCLPAVRKKVFVTGCFDMLHSGHVAFLEEAASYGHLYVCIGSDANVNNLKGKFPVNNEQERKYMLEAVRHVHHCRVNRGWGIMDFSDEMDEIRPDVFVVNEDGHTPEKENLCGKLGVEYKVLKRIPHAGLPVRSTTALRTECRIPFRIDLAGGWLDQPFVSKFYPGPVLTISIEPTLEFNDRSGMASSTRRKAIELWKTDIPAGNPEMLAKMLFSYDNPPGTLDVSGSQDALGIVMPGLNRLDYHGSYWPEKITSVMEEDILRWLEDHIFLVTLGPRTGDYTVVGNSKVSEPGTRNLAEAATGCWEAILAKDPEKFGKYFRASFEAQVAMFPNMADDSIYQAIDRYRDHALGWKLSGAGGGGYLILIANKPVPGSFQIKIRRNDNH